MSKSISKIAKADLFAESKEANLSAGGTVKKLRKRLLASRASKGKEAREVSAASQQPSVRVGSSTIEQDGSKLAANNKGKSMFDRISELEQDVLALKQG